MGLLTNLISYWKFDETSGTRVDSHGSNAFVAHGAFVAGGSNTGLIGNAVSFDGDAANYLSVASNATIQGGDTDLSISAWVLLGDNGSYRNVLAKYGVSALEYFLHYRPDIGNYSFAVSATGSEFSRVDLTDTSWSAGTFHNVQAGHDSVNNLLWICVNNGVRNTASYSAGMYAGSADLRTGTEAEGLYPWQGKIDEVLMARKALTATERALIYNNQRAGNSYPLPGTVAIDATSNSGYQAAASTYSWGHTCAGTDRYLAVDVGVLSVPGTTVTGITYNGVALSFIGAKSTVSGAGRVECWGLANPASGSNMIAVTLSASVASAGVAASYVGVDQTTPAEGFNSAQATNVGAADATVTVTTSTDNDWVHGAVATDDTAVTAGQTARNNVTGVGGSVANEDTDGFVHPAGTQAASYTGVGALATWAVAGYGVRSVQATTPSTVWVSLPPDATPQPRAQLVPF